MKGDRIRNTGWRLETNSYPILSYSAGMILCVIASISATFISGLNFPERNNVWHLPIVLNYFGTLEGPHDEYNASFEHFVSAFWIIPKFVATEANVEKVFVAIEIGGNIALGFSVYLLVRWATRELDLVAGFVVAFLCFCNGLWNNTRFGNSEIFVGFATHTEFAVVFCLLSFVFFLKGWQLWSAVLLSLAADANLFMAVWCGFSIALFSLIIEGGLTSRKQFSFAAVACLLTTPILAWALHSGRSSNEIPVEFFRTFLSDHVYALANPQAAVQTFALGLAASLAALRADPQDQALRHLGVLMLSCVAVLGIGAVMPYLTSVRLLLLLHPLRYASVVVLLSGCCAAALLVRANSAGKRLDVLPAFIAIAGFMLKSPAVSIFGLILVSRERTGWLCNVGFILVLAGPLGLLLYSPHVEMSAKSAWGFLLLCVVVSAAAWGRSTENSRHDMTTKLISACVLGCLVTVPPFPQAAVAGVFSSCAVIACLLPMTTGRRFIALGANAGCAIFVFLSVRSDPNWFIPLGAGCVVMIVAAYVPRFRSEEVTAKLRIGVLSTIVAALVGAGFAYGAVSGFSVTRSTKQRQLAAAGAWARANTSIDSMFLVAFSNDNFTIFSRRPMWWASAQGAAVLWTPSFYDLYACRTRAVTSANTPDALASLAVLANIKYLVIRARNTHSALGPAFQTVFENSHYAIVRNDNSPVSDPLCPGKVEPPSK